MYKTTVYGALKCNNSSTVSAKPTEMTISSKPMSTSNLKVSQITTSFVLIEKCAIDFYNNKI